MANTIARSDPERLPWLTDDVRRPKRTSGWVVAFVAASVVAIIAALSFWVGMNGLPQGISLPTAGAPDARIDVPPAEPHAVQQDVMPEVQPALEPGPVTLPLESEVRPSTAVAPPVRRLMRERVTIHRSRPARGRAAPVKKEAEPETKSLEFSNPWESAAASGKMVRIGTYSNLSQGKQAWSRLARVYPGNQAHAGRGHGHSFEAQRQDLLPPSDRNHFTGSFRSALPAHEDDRAKLRGRRCRRRAEGQLG